ncbi:MAG TPA: SIS domain-containing protein [Candidatus Egerieimonas intestinavium]|uniref:SIS domain-containing protein n=1 Tax=Candidatus Egerieimonas intestinavium TaxID=2840777 RepID=A0A9D1JFG8_9FIRM|nr:SIS domain-containing protein [Candidatus Egerieimonas intestinavium]
MDKEHVETREEQACQAFLETVGQDLKAFGSAINMGEIEAAARLILRAEEEGNRVHISGIGKPAHLAGYLASLLSSTGTPAYFLHGTEAVHGSCGQTRPGDVVIFISNSGETAEMRSTILAVKDNGCRVIGVSGNRDSWLARESDVHLYAGVPAEGGPLNRAPRMSVLAETLVLQTLSVYLQAHKDITPRQYVKWHPGGALGRLRENEQ